MKKANLYYKGYSESLKRIDFIKYGVMNEYGYNIEGNNQSYNEEEIIKKR